MELLEAIIRFMAASSPLITIAIGVWNNRTSKKHSAKQSILQMIMEDEFRYETFGKLPTNYSNILKEYEVYHKNGGNGEVTKKVRDYEEWLAEIEEQQPHK